jgi:hypothetical protein
MERSETTGCLRCGTSSWGIAPLLSREPQEELALEGKRYIEKASPELAR